MLGVALVKLGGNRSQAMNTFRSWSIRIFSWVEVPGNDRQATCFGRFHRSLSTQTPGVAECSFKHCTSEVSSSFCLSTIGSDTESYENDLERRVPLKTCSRRLRETIVLQYSIYTMSLSTSVTNGQQRILSNRP